MNRYLQNREALRRILLDLAPAAPGGPEAHALDALLQFSRPPKPDMGDLALAVFPLAKALRQSPQAVAQQWVESVRRELENPESPIHRLDAPPVGAGVQGPYLNLTLDPDRQARLIMASVVDEGARYGRALGPTGQTLMVEYSSPNTNKPLHLGHVRNNLIGMSLSNILEAAGDRVVRVSLVNDRGIHICKSMLAYQRWSPVSPSGERETPASTGEKGDHFVGRYYVLFNTRLAEERAAYAERRGLDPSLFAKKALRELTDRDEQRSRQEEGERFEKEFLASSELMGAASALLRNWEADDPEVLALWRTMNGWVYEGFRETYTRLGCRFDRWYFESETWQLGKREVERGLDLGVFYRQEDGSVWARLEPLGLKDKILLRSDGTSVYITQDVGTAIRKFEDYDLDQSIYVVASEQEDHFRNLFAIVKLLGYPWADRCVHASYNLVNLPRGMGRLKSREGTAADVDALLDELKRLAREKIQEGGYAEDPVAIEAAAERIGQGAMKLFVLQVSPEKVVQYDPNETIAFTGDTGPAVQYSHARIHGILRKALAAGKVASGEIVAGEAALPAHDPTAARAADPAQRSRGAMGGAEALVPRSGPFLKADRSEAALLREPEERDVLRLVADFPDVLTSARRQLSAAPVATAMLELTKAYARMYHAHEVLQADTPELLRARLQLALCVAQVVRNGLAILTIEAPERM